MIAFHTNSDTNVPLSISVKLLARFVENGAIFGGLVIIALYVLIVFEVREKKHNGASKIPLFVVSRKILNGSFHSLIACKSNTFCHVSC